MHAITGVAGQGNNDVYKLLCLPKVELEVFLGDPLKYHAFIKSFSVTVERLVKDADSRLARLLQYTAGKAHQAIQGALIIGGDSGYRFVVKTLEDLYGSKHHVTEDIIRSLRQVKLVKSAHEMRALSHELQNAYNVLQNIGSLFELNAHVIIFDVITCLPNFVQNRWQKVELKSKRDSGSYLKFKDLFEFIELAADEMSDPLVDTLARAERKKICCYQPCGSC